MVARSETMNSLSLAIRRDVGLYSHRSLTTPKRGYELWIYGTRGSVQITIEDATFYYEKSNPSDKPSSDKVANKTVVERGIVTGASYSTHGEMPYRGPGDKVRTPGSEDPTLASVRSFIEAVRGEHDVEANVDVGFRSAIACAVAHDAVYAEQKMAIPKAPAI